MLGLFLAPLHLFVGRDEFCSGPRAVSRLREHTNCVRPSSPRVVGKPIFTTTMLGLAGSLGVRRQLATQHSTVLVLRSEVG